MHPIWIKKYYFNTLHTTRLGHYLIIIFPFPLLQFKSIISASLKFSLLVIILYNVSLNYFEKLKSKFNIHSMLIMRGVARSISALGEKLINCFEKRQISRYHYHAIVCNMIQLILDQYIIIRDGITRSL